MLWYVTMETAWNREEQQPSNKMHWNENIAVLMFDYLLLKKQSQHKSGLRLAKNKKNKKK